MAEGKEKAPEAAPAGGGAGKMIMIGVASSLVSVVAALAVVYFVFVPKLAPPAHGEDGEEGEHEEVAAEEGGGEHGGGGGGGHGEESGPPKTSVEFDEATVTCIMQSPDMPASILMYQVVLDCANSNAATIIEANKTKFAAKIRELHSYKKRVELDNEQLEQDILKAVVQECNAMLQEILGKPSEKTRIKEAYHVKFFIQDL
jgi:flagellar basal body-associated protein FliL